MPPDLHTYPPLAEPWHVRLSPAGCAADLGVGSERAAYVGQDYVLRALGRPHRSVNLMYCYYPLDQGWPKRASVAFKPSGTFAWDYPYDDYFPYEGGPGGNTDGEPFRQMRDVRRHGSDVTLTLTVDCSVGNEHLERIADELKDFGRLRLRINHECDGNWFAFNKRYDHKTISDFFIRFHKVIKARAPRISTICCWGSVDGNTNRLVFEDGLAPMLEYADIWSMDRYISLHYAWPNNICEEDQRNKGFTHVGPEGVWKEMARVYEIFCERSGQKKPLELCELNADGDVGGAELQSRELSAFYGKIRGERRDYLKGVTYYQFRDKGRLGLEREDPNDNLVGVPQPFLPDYRALIRDPWFSPGEKWDRLPANAALEMDWRAADDSDGLAWKVELAGTPSFLEVKFPKEANLIVRAGTEWFYKKPGIEWVDLTAGVRHFKAGDTATVTVFAPPADGTNGGASSVRTALPTPPLLRLRYPS